MAVMAPEPTDILVLERRIARDDLVRLLRLFGDMVKYVVDVERGVVALGGELHADAEQVLLEQGSHQADLWGANYYPGHGREGCIELTSLINIRPARSPIGQRSDESCSAGATSWRASTSRPPPILPPTPRPCAPFSA